MEAAANIQNGRKRKERFAKRLAVCLHDQRHYRIKLAKKEKYAYDHGALQPANASETALW